MTDIVTKRPFAVKVLAIIGFSATILLIGWALFMLATKAPALFSSLADKAEKIDEYRPEAALELTAVKTVVNAGEEFNVSWTDMKREGAYQFSYPCTEGAVLNIRDNDGKYVPVRCDTGLNFPVTLHEVSFTITTEGLRMTELPMRIAFLDESKEEVASSTLAMTVLNTRISEGSDTEETPVETPRPSTPTPPNTGHPSTPTTPVTPPVPTRPVYTYPVSDPNGFTDLKMTTLGTGVISRDVFRFTDEYEDREENAVRIDIENIGTRTSDTWSFTTKLPDGSHYTSPSQAPLKPKEHAVFTISFSMDTRDDERIVSTVKTNRDNISSNNTSSWSVEM